MIGLGKEQLCLNSACHNKLKGGKQEIDGYCRLYCKNQAKEQEAARIAALAPKPKKQKPKVCMGVDVASFIKELKKLCESEKASIYPLGKRSAFYELYNRGVVENLTKDKFSSLYKAVNDACQNEELKDEWFIDSSRKLSYRSGDDSMAGALLSRLGITELKHWKDQPVVPIIMCEKDGHQGVLERITNARQVRLFTSKGVWSRPSLVQVANAVEALIKQGKNVVIGYVGDHDPAGLFRIERTAFEGNFEGKNTSIGLRQLLEKRCIDSGWKKERIAITTEQFRNLDIRGELELYTKVCNGCGGQVCKRNKVQVHKADFTPLCGNIIERRLWTVEECKDSALYTREEREEEGEEEEDNEKPKLKKADTNTYEYVQEYGFERADVEALGFGRMREEVKNFIELHTDSFLWDESQSNSRLEVIRGKALLSLYTRKPAMEFKEEFEAVYSDCLYDNDESESKAIADTREFFEQRKEVVTQLLEAMQSAFPSDLYTLLAEKEEALEKEEEEAWTPEESTCAHCGEIITYKVWGNTGLWKHNIDNEDALLCADGSGEIAEPAE